MIQFYAPQIAETLTLPESDSAHCARVLRLHEGDEIFVTDGKGKRYRCRITSAHSKHTTVELIDFEELPKDWPGKITVGIAPTKHIDRMEWFVEQVTQLGVDRIVLLRCARSERKEVREDRLDKILVSAMKQSLQGYKPELAGMTPYADFIKQAEGQKFMGYCDANTPRESFFKEVNPLQGVTILIGPEGDFSPEEVALALEYGFRPVTFSNHRLRTEAAGTLAVALVHAKSELVDSEL